MQRIYSAFSLERIFSKMLALAENILIESILSANLRLFNTLKRITYYQDLPIRNLETVPTQNEKNNNLD